MDPNVVAVPPTGYGPAVDIWSVGCTVIEMATGKRPFHDVVDQYALFHKLVVNKEIPEIPSDLSDLAKDFIAKCFQTTENRPTAKDLLNHAFLKMKPGLSRDPSTTEKSEHGARLSKFPSISQRSASEDDDISFHPTSTLGSQVSIDDSRRSKLLSILREPEHRAAIMSQWMDLIEESRETEFLTIDKLQILIDGICDCLDTDNEDFLKSSLNNICDATLRITDRNIRIDLERSFYHFITATNNILSKSEPPPHELFALGNINRHIVEHLIGLIRTDFLPASKSILSLTPSHDSPSRISSSLFPFNDELTTLHEEYQNIAQRNQELLRQLIAIERTTEVELLNEINSSSKQEYELFQSVNNYSNVNSSKQINGENHHLSKGTKRSIELIELEQEQEHLLKKIANNRTRINQILHTENC